MKNNSRTEDLQRPAASPPTSSLIDKAVRVISTALRTDAVWAGSGAAIVCAGTSLTGVVGHAVSTLMTLNNKLRAGQYVHQIESTSPTWLRRGHAGLVRDLVRSPGFNMIIGGMAYAAAAAQSLASGNINLSAAFSSFVIAQISVTAIANQDYFRESTDWTLAERVCRSLWNAAPTRMKNIFRNPAVWFSVGNIMLVLPGLMQNGFSADPIPQTLIALGIGFAVIGLMRGLSVLMNKHEGGNPTGLASYLMGLSSLLIGSACVTRGNLPVGLANICWAVSNTLWGRGLDRIRPA